MKRVILRRNPNRIQRLIKDRVSYIDTVQMWFPRALTDTEIKNINALCGPKRMFPIVKDMPVRPKWKCRHLLQQPKPEVFDYLTQLFGEDIWINRVDVALDLITRRPTEARLLKEFCERHIYHAWHGKYQIVRYKHSTYTAERGAPRVYDIYADKPSKVANQPCCHIELRFSGADSVRRAGFVTVHDLKNLNYHEFWKKHLRLREFDVEKLGRHFLHQPHAKKPVIVEYVKGRPFDKFRRTGSLILRASALTEKPASVQEVLDFFRDSKFNPSKCINTIDTTSFLPPPQN